MVGGKTKYKLFAANGVSSDGLKPVCAFFQSEEGCRNGAKCKFRHEKVSEAQASLEQADASSIISSETDDSSEEDVTVSDLRRLVSKRSAKSAKKEVKDQPSKKKARRGTNSSPFANQSQQNKETTEEKDSNPFLPPNVKTTTVSDQVQLKGTPEGPQTKNRSNTKQVKAKSAKNPKKEFTMTPKASNSSPTHNGISSFALNLGLPVSNFSIPGVDKDQALVKLNVDITDPKRLVPSQTPEGRKWAELVKLTRDDPRFERMFSYEEKDENWINAKSYGDWCKNIPHAIAIDCEMCATKCPETGKINPKALCRLSVVNAVNPADVLIDTLVKPDWPVIDYRTWVNGIKKEHLENVQFTFEHAQSFMKALCSQETVIIGHALNNDLEALKMEHYCVVDSSLILKVKDEETRCPSLKDSTKQLLDQEMPKTHDSVNDARVSLSLMEFYLQQAGKVNPIIPTPKEKATQKLFIHRIPRFVKENHLVEMVQQYTNIIPTSIEDIEFNGNTGKTHVLFSSEGHASLAFNTIKAQAKPDKTGRLQKKIFMRNNEYIQVRQMSKPRPSADEKDGSISGQESK